MMSWIETPGIARPYGTIVRYWCPQKDWGYPSSGLNQLWSECGKNGEWNVTEVENCVGNIPRQIYRGPDTDRRGTFEFPIRANLSGPSL